jgi:hypothetical protein
MRTDDVPGLQENTGAALRRLAAETRDRATAARAESRELSSERRLLLDALRAGWREQASLMGALQDSRDELHSAVRAYTSELRRCAVPPERMLVELKQLVRETSIPRAPHPQQLMDQVVSWGIDAYFEDARR